MRTQILFLMLLGLLPILGTAQTVIAYESFEQTTQEHGFTTMPSSECNCCDVNDTWERTSNSGCVNPTIDGMHGTYYWVAEDIDDPDIQDASSASIAPYSAIILDAVDVKDYTNLEINLMAAVGMTGYFQLGDFLRVQYAFDADIAAGNYTTAGQFIADAFVDDDLSFDANADGTIDGASLNNTLSDYTVSLGGLLGDELSVRILFNCNSFSEEIIVDYIRVSGILSPLPVSWSSFEVNIVEQTALLEWSTATESNNEGFEVEWSRDSRNWTRLGFVAAEGDASDGASYRFTDTRVEEGQNFYRLRQIDTDGRYAYSDIRSVQYIEGGLLSIGQVYPNPVIQENVYIEIYSPNKVDLELRLLSMGSGRLAEIALFGQIEAGMTLLDLQLGQQIPNGAYVVQLIAGEEVMYHPLIINR